MNSFRTVLVRTCLPLLGAGLLIACSSEDPAQPETEEAGLGGVVGGSSGASVGGGTTGSGGASEGSGGTSPGSGGATTGSGGATTGSGGATTGSGGSDPASGGSDPASGGSDPASGGTETGAGGSEMGAGGAETGAGGTETGAGGTEMGTGGAGLGGASVIADPPPDEDYTEEVNGVTIDMVYVPGGNFTIGCETAPCPADAQPVSGVTVSSYHIGKTEVTRELWEAVMGETSSGFGGPTDSFTSMTWYDAMEFACALGQLTGRNYRMTTEAEWEYAAKNHLASLLKVGSGEEWAYNSWSSAHSGGVDPVGDWSGQHTQKTRRDAEGTADNITGRLIRSIEGIGPALRLALSADMDIPADLVHPCNIHVPQMGPEPENSYRDLRWVTGSDAHWAKGPIAIGSLDLRVWEDGTARMGSTNGQWFTSNNIVFVFVPSSGTITKYAYIFLDEIQGSVITDQGFGFGSNGYIGRIVKEAASSVEKPAIAELQSGAALAAAAGPDYAMVDMVNIPESARQQDPRLLDGTSQGWFQNNSQNGGVHHYRKDVDPDEFRFTVNQGTNRTMLANGAWFTVNNTFLRVTHSSGYAADYLYAVDADGTFYHNSFMAYERADFRMFEKTDNGTAFSSVCGSICSDEIPKGEAVSVYANLENGDSTFVPAPCPAGGCE